MALVLVVDDEMSIVALLRDVLEDEGHTVLAAYNGQEALALAYAHPLAVIVTDNMMPGMSGVELVRRLLADPPAPKRVVVLMSAAHVPELAEFGDAVTFIAKPFDIAAVLDLIAR